jgi:hypothetical protein
MARKKWRPVSEMDARRLNKCRVRMKCCGREMHAIWGIHPVMNDGDAWCWIAEDNQVYGLHDVAEFQLLSSLPAGSKPRGNSTDAELLADVSVDRKEPVLLGSI